MPYDMKDALLKPVVTNITDLTLYKWNILFFWGGG